MPAPEVREQANGAPMTTPPLEVMWKAWHTVTCVASQRCAMKLRERSYSAEPYNASLWILDG